MKPYLFTLLLLGFTIVGKSQINFTAGLRAYYDFSGNFNDKSGNSNNGTAKNGTSFATDRWGKANSAAKFDGVDDWVEVASSASLTPKSAMCIVFHFKTAKTNGQVLMSKSDYVGTSKPENLQYQIGFNYPSLLGGNGLFFATEHDGSCITSSSTFSSYTFAGTPVDTSAWHCVIMSFESSIKKVYVDGILKKTDTVKTGSATNIDSCAGGIYKMGTWWQGDPQMFKGLMDEVRIYNRILTTNELDSICKYVPVKTDTVDTDITDTDTTTNITTFTYGYNDGDDVLLYPNPVINNTLHINTSFINAPYCIYNQVGAMVYKGTITNKETTLDISNLPSGIYVLNIIHENAVISKRYIKK